MTPENFLQQQGETIAQAIEQRGYQTKRLTGDLIGWEVTDRNSEWWALLTFIPRPVAQWRVLPAGWNERNAEIYRIIEQTIGGRR